MRAAYLQKTGDASVLCVGDLPTPEPGRGQVRVRVTHSSLNHLDVWVRRGLPHLKMSFPHILGADGVGTVDKLGVGVTRVKVGDAVVIHPGISCGTCAHCTVGIESLCADYQILGENRSGTNAEFVVVPEANVFLSVPQLQPAELASIPLVFVTAWQMVVERAAVQPGQLVLVHAAGSGVSAAAIQVAKLQGATVFATAGTESKLQSARWLGAAEVFNYRNEDWFREVRDRAGRGFDVIIDHVGADLWENNIKLLARGGKLVTCGATSGFTASTDLRHLFFRQLNLMGSTMGSKRHFPRILECFASGALRPSLDRLFPLAEIAQAHLYLERREQFGKVVLSI